MADDQPPTNTDDVNERRPNFQTPQEQESFNAAIFQQLQAQPTVAAENVPPVDDVASHIEEATGHNKQTIRCRFCDCKVLLADSSKYERKEYSLHLLGGSKDDPTRETLSDWWFVSSQMNFENVGVTKSVDPAYRYLTCANCDRGPIGINYLNEPTKFYVAHARIRYDN